MTKLKTPLTLALSLLLCLAMIVPAVAAEDTGAQTRPNIPCGFVWLNTDLQNIRLEGIGTAVVRPQAGTFTLRCKLALPEDDPSIASFETVCGVVGEYCVNGVAIVGYDLLSCTVDGQYTSDDTMALVTRSGQYVFICHGTLDGG